MDLNIKGKKPQNYKAKGQTHVLFAFKPFILHTKIAL